MKRNEVCPCDVCGLPLTGKPNSLYRNGIDAGYRVEFQRMFANHDAVRRAHAMDQYFGNAALASVFDEGEDLLLEPLEFRTKAVVCVDCAMRSIFELTEAISERREAAAERGKAASTGGVEGDHGVTEG